MTKAEKLGRKAYDLNPDHRERFKGSHQKRIETEVQTKKEQLTRRIQAKSEEEKRMLTDIERKGNPIEVDARTNFHRGIWLGLTLIIPLIAEFIFTNWTIGHLALGSTMSLILSAAIVILSWEGFDQYLTAFRKRNPNLDGLLFLLLSCVGLVFVFLLFLLAAEIRKNAHLVQSMISLDASPENIVTQAEEFHESTDTFFVWLMLSMTMVFCLIGGVGYHLARNLITNSAPVLRLFRRLRKTRREIDRAQHSLRAEGQKLAQFIAEFESGFVDEAVRQSNKQNSAKLRAQKKTKLHGKVTKIALLAVFPVTLLAIALAVFLLLKAEAHGAERLRIVLLDMSKSVDVTAYSTTLTEFEKNVFAIDDLIQHKIRGGDRLKVIGITECSFSSPYILLDERIADEPGLFGEGLARDKLRLSNKWKAFELEPDANGTDIFGAISLVAVLFSADASDKHMVILSDMRQSTYVFDLEGRDHVDAENLVSEVEQKGFIPRLEGVKVWCLGVDTAEKSHNYWQGLRDFWRTYFDKAGATLEMFSVERRFNDE